MRAYGIGLFPDMIGSLAAYYQVDKVMHSYGRPERVRGFTFFISAVVKLQGGLSIHTL